MTWLHPIAIIGCMVAAVAYALFVIGLEPERRPPWF